MALLPDAHEMWAVVTHGLSAFFGVLGTAIVALITRKPAMLTVVDSNLKTLLDGYREYTANLVKAHERQMSEMRNELSEARKELSGALNEILLLERKVDILTNELQEAKAARGFGA